MRKKQSPSRLDTSGRRIDVSNSEQNTIAFLTSDWAWGTEPLQPNGCAWYRCVLPGVQLEKLGWTVGVGMPCFNERDGFGLVSSENKGIHGWDLIVFKLLMHKDILECMKKALDMGQKIIVDVDDFFDGLHEENRAFEATDPDKNPDNNRKILHEIILRSTAVITSTPFLRDYYSQFHKNVFMVRNGIDSERFLHIPKPRRQHHRTRIGWVGATPWRSRDLDEVSPFMNSFMALNNVRFHHSGDTAGAKKVTDELKIESKWCSTLPLVPISEYPKLFSPIDIGIVPLRDVPFNHAKSFIKGLEYAAAGIPFVASYSPEYEFLANDGIGRIARNTKEWEYHLKELLDPAMRRDEAAINREKLRNYTIQARANDWDEVYRKILNG
jgi:glycosyltransferase involved in cell wall biosynthesis